jgi:hypothetical protein
MPAQRSTLPMIVHIHAGALVMRSWPREGRPMSESVESIDAPVLLRVSSPDELLSAIPYLVGFYPADSLVLIGLNGSRVVITARLDLQDCREAELDHALAIVGRARADTVVVALYTDADNHEDWGGFGIPFWAPVLGPLFELADQHDLYIGDVFVVRGDRFWYVEDAADDEAGRPLDPATSRAAATATFAGLVARPDRATLLAILDQDDDAVRAQRDERLADYESEAVKAILNGSGLRQQRGVKRAIFAAARKADETLPIIDNGAGRMGELYRYAVGLTDIVVRDAVWVAVDHGRLDGRALWRELLRTMPAPYDAAPLFLFGWASWRDGNGVLAAEAAVRALESDPTYSAADLLLGAIRHGLDPHRVPRLRGPRTRAPA